MLGVLLGGSQPLETQQCRNLALSWRLFAPVCPPSSVTILLSRFESGEHGVKVHLEAQIDGHLINKNNIIANHYLKSKRQQCVVYRMSMLLVVVEKVGS